MHPQSLPARLRALPGYNPPAGGWQRLSQRLAARRRTRLAAGGGLALAASVVTAAVVVGWTPPDPAVPEPVAVAAVSRPVAGLPQLIERSQQLERALAAARPEVVMWDSRRALSAAALERELRRLDAEMVYADAASTERLWRDRVALMNALVQLHESPAPALHYASYQY